MSEITKKIEAQLCEDCRTELEAMVLSLRTRDKLRPLKTANKFLNALCPECKKKAVSVVTKNNKTKS